MRAGYGIAASAMVFTFSVLSLSAWAGELTSVRVTGDSTADVLFVVGPEQAMPTMQIDDNNVDLIFNDATLSTPKLDLTSPHTLIQRVSAYPGERGTVHAKVVVNGSIENLRKRLSLRRDAQGIRLDLSYPAGEQATWKLLKEEQAPLQSDVAPIQASVGRPGWGRLIIALLVFSLAGAGTYFAGRVLRKRGSWKGSRKFLVENLAYCPIGQGGKTGVSLIKVGSEFVLIGVTSQQVTLLSSLPKLQEQYEQEAKFDRESFRAAVEQEVDRMKGTFSV